MCHFTMSHRELSIVEPLRKYTYITFCLIVEGGEFAPVHEVVFLRKAKPAHSSTLVIGLGPIQDLQVYVELYSLLLQFPNMVDPLIPIVG